MVPEQLEELRNDLRQNSENEAIANINSVMKIFLPWRLVLREGGGEFVIRLLQWEGEL